MFESGPIFLQKSMDNFRFRVLILVVETIGREGGSTATDLVCEIFHILKKTAFSSIFLDF